MKGLITFAIIAGILVVAGYAFLGNMMAADSGELLAFACGNESEGMQQIQIVVPIAFKHREPPKVSESGVVLWKEWIADHWILTGASGERVDLKRKFAANLIPEHKVGTPECYLIGSVKTGEKYTLEFVKSVAKGKRYRSEIEVLPEGVPFQRVNFEPV
jgi:hypothetical protein